MGDYIVMVVSEYIAGYLPHGRTMVHYDTTRRVASTGPIHVSYSEAYLQEV